ncbi:MAG: methyl-accepting chemotaxis protein [Colwellia sp.]
MSAREEVGKMIGDIDSAGREQSAGIGEVSAAVSQMDELTQKNAALVEEAAASSKSMEEQSQALLDQVAFFNSDVEEEAPVTKTPTRRSAVQRNSKAKPTRPLRRT